MAARGHAFAWACAGLLCAAAQAATVQDWPLPDTGPAAQPGLVEAPDGGLLLSWTAPQGEGHALRMARWNGRAFGAVSTVARGTRWFVNWADVPALRALPDGSLHGFILRRTADAPYAYDILLTASRDGGARWSRPRLLHDDGTATEHGFVALWPDGDDHLGIAWLDGRQTAGGADGHAHHSGAGAMSLRATRLPGDHGETGARPADAALDARTCDCCQTDAAVTRRGPVVVYRDRSPDEVRDIALVRRDGTGWTAPRTVHADGWVMPGCPVNGPAVAAAGDTVWVAWFTAAHGTPAVRLARSQDAGDRFDPPQTMATGPSVLGRVDLQLDADGRPWVSWMAEDADGPALWLGRVALDGPQPAPVRIATLPRGPAAGVPRLALQGGTAHLVWTTVLDGRPRLRGARVRLDAAAEASGD